MATEIEMPIPGKTDLIKGILLGMKQTKRSRISYGDNKPSSIILRLTKVAQESSCLETKQKANKAIELLSLKFKNCLNKETSDKERKTIFDKLSTSLVEPKQQVN